MINVEDLQALPDKAIVERLDETIGRLDESTVQGNKVYGLENSDYPLIGDNFLAIQSTTTQGYVAEKIASLSYDLIQQATDNGYSAMIPDTYKVNVVHTNNGSNDIIVSISACFTDFK